MSRKCSLCRSPFQTMYKIAVVERFCNEEPYSHSHTIRPELIVNRIVVSDLLCRGFTQPRINNIKHLGYPRRDIRLLGESLANCEGHRWYFDYIKFVTHSSPPVQQNIKRRREGCSEAAARCQKIYFTCWHHQLQTS